MVVVQLDLHAVDVDGQPLCAGGILALAALDKQVIFIYYFLRIGHGNGNVRITETFYKLKTDQQNTGFNYLDVVDDDVKILVVEQVVRAGAHEVVSVAVEGQIVRVASGRTARSAALSCAVKFAVSAGAVKRDK